MRHRDGPARVVCLHGWGRTGRDFDAVADLLGDVATVAFDLPGFGASAAPTQPGGAGLYADLLTPALAEAVADRADGSAASRSGDRSTSSTDALSGATASGATASGAGASGTGASGTDGCGTSGPGDRSPASADTAAVGAGGAEPSMQSRGDGRAVLVCHSFGGRAGIVLARRRPDLVAGLVLTGVPLLARADRGRRSRPAWRYRAVRMLHAKGLIGEQRMERQRIRFGSADYAAAAGVMRDVLVRAVHETYETDMADISQPVELVWGADDSDVPVETAQQAQQVLRCSKLTVVDGAGHFLPLEDAPSVADATLRLLRRLDGPDAPHALAH